MLRKWMLLFVVFNCFLRPEATSDTFQPLTCTSNVLHQCKCGENGTLKIVFVESCLDKINEEIFDCIACPEGCLKFSHCATCGMTQCLTCPVGRSGQFCELAGELLATANVLNDTSNELKSGDPTIKNYEVSNDDKNIDGINVSFKLRSTVLTNPESFPATDESEENEMHRMFSKLLERESFEIYNPAHDISLKTNISGPSKYLNTETFNTTFDAVSNISDRVFLNEDHIEVNGFTVSSENTKISSEEKIHKYAKNEPSEVKSNVSRENYSSSSEIVTYGVLSNNFSTPNNYHHVIIPYLQKKDEENKIFVKNASEEVEKYYPDIKENKLSRVLVNNISTQRTKFGMELNKSDLNDFSNKTGFVKSLSTGSNKNISTQNNSTVELSFHYNNTKQTARESDAYSDHLTFPNTEDMEASDLNISNTNSEVLGTTNKTDIISINDSKEIKEKKWSNLQNIPIPVKLMNFANSLSFQLPPSVEFCNMHPFDPHCTSKVNPFELNYPPLEYPHVSPYPNLHDFNSMRGILNRNEIFDSDPQVKQERDYFTKQNHFPTLPVGGHYMFPNNFNHNNFYTFENKRFKNSTRDFIFPPGRLPSIHVPMVSTIPNGWIVLRKWIVDKPGNVTENYQSFWPRIDSRLQNFHQLRNIPYESNVMPHPLIKNFGYIKSRPEFKLPFATFKEPFSSFDSLSRYPQSRNKLMKTGKESISHIEDLDNYSHLNSAEVFSTNEETVPRNEGGDSTGFKFVLNLKKNSMIPYDLLRQLLLPVFSKPIKFENNGGEEYPNFEKRLFRSQLNPHFFSTRRDVMPNKIHLEYTGIMLSKSILPLNETESFITNGNVTFQHLDEESRENNNSISGKKNNEFQKMSTMKYDSSMTSKFINSRTRREADDEWCPLSIQSLNGDLECIVWSYQKSCELKCHAGYGSTQTIFNCNYNDNQWNPPLRPCVGKNDENKTGEAYVPQSKERKDVNGMDEKLRYSVEEAPSKNVLGGISKQSKNDQADYYELNLKDDQVNYYDEDYKEEKTV